MGEAGITRGRSGGRRAVVGLTQQPTNSRHETIGFIFRAGRSNGRHSALYHGLRYPININSERTGLVILSHRQELG